MVSPAPNGALLDQMIPVEGAIKIVDRETLVLGAEAVPLADAVGRVLAEDIIADSDMPPFDRSQMDGYAVKSSDVSGVPVKLKIVGESAAGRGWHYKLKKGEAVRIMTGAPVPAGADAVQKIEVASEVGEQVEILESAAKGQFIIARGAEIKKGQAVIAAGERVTANTVASLAAFGYANVKLGERPRVAILATGSEIIGVGQKPGEDQIRNSNSPMLRVFTEECGAAAVTLPIATDDLDELKGQISKAVERADVLVITGGVSVGKYDLTKTALLELGADIFFDKVSLKPGKPTVFARLNNKLVFGLPGNPVSVAATFFLFVRPALLKMQGAADPYLKQGNARVSSRLKGTRERDAYLPASLFTTKRGRLIAEPLRWHGSSDFVGFARAEAMIFVPAGVMLEKDDTAKIIFLP